VNVYLKQAVGSGYESFWDCRKRYRIVKGGRASKKSRTTALWYIFNLMKFFHVYNTKPCLLVLRRYLNTHRTSTRSELIWAIGRLGVSHLWEIPRGELTLTYKPSGQVILFRGFDDPESLTSISVPDGFLCWSWVEEFFQIHDEGDFNKLDLSLRGAMPEELFIQITATMNAWNSLSWIKKRFFDKPDHDVFTDTTTYTQNEFLSVEDFKVFEKLRISSPKRFLVEGLGQWGSCEGLIYADYVDNPEKCHGEISVDDKPQFISVGLDYGSGTPDSNLGKTVLSAVAVTKGFKKAYCIKESYFNDVLLPDRITAWVKKFILELKSDYKLDIILHCEYASSTVINNALILELQGIKGLKIEDCYKSTILDRIDLVNYLLGQGRLIFTKAVPHVKAGFAQALWDTEKGKLKGIPARLDNGTSDIDILDATEYALSKYSNYLMAG